MNNKVLEFIPLITLVRVDPHISDGEWDRIEFMDLNFDDEGESIALCDGEGYYIQNVRVRELFQLAKQGHYKISMEGYSSM